MAAIKTEIQVLLIVGTVEMYKIYLVVFLHVTLHSDVLINVNYSKHIL